MRIARMLFVVALVIGTSQTVSAGDGHEGHNHSPAKSALSSRDQLRIAVQGICPISGGKLGSMGTPIKAKIGQENVFLCCKGCFTGKVKPQHWATIHANFAKAQRICPVMKKPLPKNPKWTIVEGQIIYVCCPSCTKKIAADPGKYLRSVDSLYSASLPRRTVRR